MIAVGGGSVMDTAKAVNIMIGRRVMTSSHRRPGGTMGGEPNFFPPHIAFPTTAGTGCEVTNAMVVLDTERARKAFGQSIPTATP